MMRMRARTMAIATADWRDAPGLGDLDPGEEGCLGGACPHDHDSLDLDDEYGNREWEDDYEAMVDDGADDIDAWTWL